MAGRLIGVILTGLGAVFVATSMRMNYFAGLRIGETAEEGVIFGWLAVAVAGINAGLPPAIALAWRRREWGVALAGTLLLGLFLAYSLGSALGYAAGNRGAVARGKEALTASYEAAQKKETDLLGQLDPLAKARPAEVIVADMGRYRQDRLWAATRECVDATAIASREFCKVYKALETELASAVKAAELRADLKPVVGELEKLRAQGAGGDPDPQATVLGWLFGISTRDVRSAWSVLFAVLVELGCAFVPFIGISLIGAGQVAPAARTESMKVQRLEPEIMTALAKMGRKRRSRRRRQRTPPPLLELPPLRKTEFGEDGQLKVTDE